MTQREPGVRMDSSVVDQHRLRDRLLTHLEVGRPDLVFYSGLVGVAGAVLASGTWSGWQLLGAWAAPTFGWFAAMYGGDYFDRELDKVTKAQRPIPSGRMSAGTARNGMVVWALLGMVIAVALNPVNLALVALAWSFGLAYSKFLKTRGVWGNLSRGAITMCAFGVGAFATTDSPSWVLLPVALVFGLHDAASNVVGAICDADGDREGGYRTFPVRHGEKASLWLMSALHLAWMALAIGHPAALLPGFATGAYAPLLTIAIGMALFSAAMLLRASRPIARIPALKSHEVLVIERLVLGCAVVAGAAGFWWGVGLLVPFVVATIASSLLLMRGSYEPSRRWRARSAA
ncbi:UbiA family prenyltransferase [Amycolatopsis palatopharyngis]|uniref:UbiA family prenyltransferase n=1 Tax=Amycolatopsis palatopharyngis TaxID=187982 RepID=UPI0013BE9770|nr:UbiA family prenyltransferase [Amycolatopsis palatopharyngis]